MNDVELNIGRSQDSALSILANNERLAAIEGETGIKAVFFKPSQLESSTNITIAADKACILSLSGNQLMVCDPARQYEFIALTINGRAVVVALPQGDYLGSPVTIEL